MTSLTSGTYTLVNVFTPKNGASKELLDMQLREMGRLREAAAAAGWLDNEVYRARDGERLVVVTRFESPEAQRAWAASAHFGEHLDRIGPLVERVESIPVEQVARHTGAARRAANAPLLRLAVITGSTRSGRFAETPARWIANEAAATGRFAVTPVDLRDHALPFFDDPAASAAQIQAAEDFAALISGFDAYVFTVAEYNHAPTAVLKNALDHAEWTRRPAGLVGYGGVGGARAVEHLRGIAAELEMVTARTAVHISFQDYLAITEGRAEIGGIAHLGKAAGKMLDQLAWWGDALRSAREPLRAAA